MAVTTVLFWISLVISVIGSNAEGELAVLHSPDSLQFTGSSPVAESELKEIFSAAFGLSVEENSEWDGLVIKDPFKSPEATVIIYVDGVASLGEAAHLKGPKYPLIADEYEPDTFDAMKHRMQQRFTGGNSNLVSIKLCDPDVLTLHSNIFGEITISEPQKQLYQHLNVQIEEDSKFIKEINVFNSFIDKVKSGAIVPDNQKDVFYFRFCSLHAINDFYGPNSLQAKEAKKILGQMLERCSKAYAKVYDGSVLVTAVTTDVAHSRRAIRSASETEFRATKKESYPEEYAAIFNILLWFGVVFVFTLVAIVYAMIDMDPGRDSIIYRMTSTRMKKEN